VTLGPLLPPVKINIRAIVLEILKLLKLNEKDDYSAGVGLTGAGQVVLWLKC
jgi:hypothetical protein